MKENNTINPSGERISLRERLSQRAKNVVLTVAAFFGIATVVYLTDQREPYLAEANVETPVPFRTVVLGEGTPIPPTVTGGQDPTSVAPYPESPVPLRTISPGPGTPPPTTIGSENPSPVATHPVDTATPRPPTETPVPTATEILLTATPTKTAEIPSPTPKLLETPLPTVPATLVPTQVLRPVETPVLPREVGFFGSGGTSGGGFGMDKALVLAGGVLLGAGGAFKFGNKLIAKEDGTVVEAGLNRRQRRSGNEFEEGKKLSRKEYEDSINGRW